MTQYRNNVSPAYFSDDLTRQSNIRVNFSFFPPLPDNKCCGGIPVEELWIKGKKFGLIAIRVGQNPLS